MSGHTGHRVRGRYREGEQISHAVAGLRRGQRLALECGGTVEHCRARVQLTLQGVYDVEFRDGAPAEHFRTRTQSLTKAVAILTAWAGAQPGWSEKFDWTTCRGSEESADQAAVSDEPPISLPAPAARPASGAKRNGRVPIYHVALRGPWEAAQQSGEYRISTGGSRSAEQGFIHACFADQVETMAAGTRAPLHEPPVLLVIDEDALPGAVRVEFVPSRRGFFPFIHGPLPVTAVSNVFDLECGRDVRWHWRFADDWALPMPSRIPIAREAGQRTDLAGRYTHGLFLAGFAGTTYLHLFDRNGVHRRSWTAPAEHVLGADAPTVQLMDHLKNLIDGSLPRRRFADIAVEPFAVLGDDGRRWGLFDETVGFGIPHAELRPDRLGFRPPWDGLYDT